MRIDLHRCPLAALLACLLLPCLPAHARSEAPKVGVQLWSVKDDVKRDFEGTLSKLAAMGFQGVEFAGEFGRFGGDGPGLRTFMTTTGLRCAGAHLDFDALGKQRFAATTAFYKAAGCELLVIAMDQRAQTTHGARAVAADLARLAARLKPLGMQIGYHNHAVEMAGATGQTPWDEIARGTPPAVVLQQDTGWTVYAGKDPASVMARYPGRTRSAHFKAKLAPGTAGTPIIGRDKTDWPTVFRAACASGARWVVLEQEEYPDGMTPLEAVAASLAGLQKVLSYKNVDCAKEQD